MALYTPTSGIAKGLQRSINRAILALTAPIDPTDATLSPVHLLMNGHDKTVIVQWRGGLDDEDFNEEWNPDRGDGDAAVIATKSIDMLPPNVPVNYNRWAATPLWVLGHSDEGPVVIAAGFLHPWINSAHLDFWCPTTHQHVIRLFLVDPRPPEGMESRRRGVGLLALAHKSNLRDQGGMLLPVGAIGRRPDWS